MLHNQLLFADDGVGLANNEKHINESLTDDTHQSILWCI